MVLSTVEFLVFAVVVGAIAVAFGLRHAVFATVLAAGAALNGLVIAAFGLCAWRRGERGSSLAQVFSGKGRAELIRHYPTLAADTWLLALAVLVPFLVLVTSALECGRGERGAP